MIATLLDWLGLGEASAQPHGPHGHTHGPGDHGHTHGVIDATIATTARGIWAIKWSFAVMAITAVLQLAVVLFSGSVALLADTIHNFGDAMTAVPLWVAFTLARRRPTETFNYGLGRVEDLAGIIIVLIILLSAILAGYEAINRLLHPQGISGLGWVAATGLVGFLGNEVVAMVRIRIGREINSAALIADGYHARTDGLTSLAVVLGALGVWAGFPLADPIVGLVITVAIFGIVWQSSKAVFTRLLDGVEPNIVAEIRHAAEHVPGIVSVVEAKARWLGHALLAEVSIAVDGSLALSEANRIAAALERELHDHLPALKVANIRFDLSSMLPSAAATGTHHHAPEPFNFAGRLASGTVAIVSTGDGERLQFTSRTPAPGLEAVVSIHRPGGDERLTLAPLAGSATQFLSAAAPAEPHEFDAELTISANGQTESLPFHMSEPEGHAHP